MTTELTGEPENTEGTVLADGEAGETEGKEEVTTDEVETKEEEAPAGAPEAYEDFVMPEGVEVDAGMLTKFQEVAKELNLPQEAAQKIVDVQTAAIQEQGEAVDAQWVATNEEWVTSAKNDSEIGGVNWDQSVSNAKKVIDKFGSDGFREMLEVTGMGNHPETIRLLAKIGKSMAEDTLHTGSHQSAPKKSAAELLFPSMSKE